MLLNKKLGDWAQVLLAQVENTPVDTWDWLASSKTFCALSYWKVPDEHAEGAALRKLLYPVTVYDAASKILIGDNCGGFMEPVTFRCRDFHCDSDITFAWPSRTDTSHYQPIVGRRELRSCKVQRFWDPNWSLFFQKRCLTVFNSWSEVSHFRSSLRQARKHKTQPSQLG